MTQGDAEGRRWVVDLDLERFFDRVNHDILMARVARKVEDKRVLGLGCPVSRKAVEAPGQPLQEHDRATLEAEVPGLRHDVPQASAPQGCGCER